MGKTLSFTGDTYQKKNNAQINEQGNFQINADATVEASTCLTIPAGSYGNNIVLSGDSTGRKYFFQINSDTLHIIGGCFAVDAGTISTYTRL